jgi:hypothetical membrane protein
MIRSIEDQVRKTYFGLRAAAAIIAFAFPLLLWFGGERHKISLQGSMSAYYHATEHSQMPSDAPCTVKNTKAEEDAMPAGTMRNWFVGLLFAIGAILYVNKGHSTSESWFLTVAGAFAVLIAICPMPWTCSPADKVTAHGASAIIFFVCIAIVSAVFSRNTVKMLNTETQQNIFHTIYIALAVFMIASPAVAYVFTEVSKNKERFAFVAEVLGIYAFGAYWVTKGIEIKKLENQRKQAVADNLPEKVPVA